MSGVSRATSCRNQLIGDGSANAGDEIVPRSCFDLPFEPVVMSWKLVLDNW